MKQMTLREFQELCENDIRDSESVALVGEDGGYLATVIVPESDFIKLSAEHLGEVSNGVKPKAAA